MLTAEATTRCGAWSGSAPRRLLALSSELSARPSIHSQCPDRSAFMAEVSEKLQQLGMTACLVCGSAEPLDVGHFPLLLVDGEFPQGTDAGHLVEDRDLQMTFAVQIECTTCGHLMLFNAERYRTGDEKILMLVPCRAPFASAVSPIPTGSARLSQRSRTCATRIIVVSYCPDKDSKCPR
jgi:hypothetical protein